MKVCILMGSPRKNGNTASLLKPFTEELTQAGTKYTTIWLYDKNISPCIACCKCQNMLNGFECALKDDMHEIADIILESDLIVLAAPIYSWYCTPPMKAAIDRLVYGMNKYFGDENGPALWAGKSLALITTCGYKPEKGADLWEEGIKRYCRHSQLKYVGMLAERDLGYKSCFMDEEKALRAKEFAIKLLSQI